MFDKWKNNEMKELFKTISEFKNEKEIGAFMRDVATIRELEEMSKRWKAAKLLAQKNTYRAISMSTGLSTTTVSRVAFWMENGEGGYKRALKN